MADLFDRSLAEDMAANAPLADRMRPSRLKEFVGQTSIIGPKTILRQAIDTDQLFSMIFWGPPGSGKTTLAKIIAAQTTSAFMPLSGVLSSKADLLAAVQAAQERRKFKKTRTILFVDEIHRWNKAQQDALLPFVENGTVTLVGATTENPSFEVISPLLSRCTVFVLERLQPDDLKKIVEQALAEPRGYGGQKIVLEPQAIELLTNAANGDARAVLNVLELAVKATPAVKGEKSISVEAITEAFQRPNLMYDKKGEEHYNSISAFIKSMRGSQPDATLYWLGRMVEAGEDPLFIARRMVVFASEDVSLADVHALPLAVACLQACDMIGLPECAITLSHVATYLATCPKSNATYLAYAAAVTDVKKTLNQPVPMNLRNAPTQFMKELGYHQGYKYSHDYEGSEGAQDYLPASLADHKYYHPKKQ